MKVRIKLTDPNSQITIVNQVISGSGEFIVEMGNNIRDASKKRVITILGEVKEPKAKKDADTKTRRKPENSN